MGGHSAWRKRVAKGELAKGSGGAILRHHPRNGRKGKDLALNRKGNLGGHGNPKKKKSQRLSNLSKISRSGSVMEEWNFTNKSSWKCHTSGFLCGFSLVCCVLQISFALRGNLIKTHQKSWVAGVRRWQTGQREGLFCIMSASSTKYLPWYALKAAFVSPTETTELLPAAMNKPLLHDILGVAIFLEQISDCQSGHRNHRHLFADSFRHDLARMPKTAHSGCMLSRLTETVRSTDTSYVLYETRCLTSSALGQGGFTMISRGGLGWWPSPWWLSHSSLVRKVNWNKRSGSDDWMIQRSLQGGSKKYLADPNPRLSY